MTPEQRKAHHRLLLALPRKTHHLFKDATKWKHGKDAVACEVESVYYISIAAAAKDHSVSPSTIRRWIKGEMYGAKLVDKELCMITTEQIVNTIPENSEISAKNIALALGVSEKHIYSRLSQIPLDRHRITRTGSRRHYRYRREHTPDTAADSGNPTA